jgi:hypothetical protein
MPKVTNENDNSHQTNCDDGIVTVILATSRICQAAAVGEDGVNYQGPIMFWQN